MRSQTATLTRLVARAAMALAAAVALAGEGADPRALPPSLREVLLARVVRLDHRTQQLLRVTAAAGPGVTQALLAAVTDMGEAALLDGLREAVDQQLLVPDGDGYVFRHALLAEAVYGELLAGERVRLHTALAGALEAGRKVGEVPASRAARLAYHWSAAGDQPRALATSIQAAAAAEGVYAFAEAQLQLERVLALWDQVPDAQECAGMDRAMALARCAEAAYAAGDTARAAELVRQADLPGRGMAALGAVEIGDPDRRAVSGHHLGDDAGTTAAADHMDHHLVVLEHPVPAGAAVDAHAGDPAADDLGPGREVADGVVFELERLENGVQACDPQERHRARARLRR